MAASGPRLVQGVNGNHEWMQLRSREQCFRTRVRARSFVVKTAKKNGRSAVQRTALRQMGDAGFPWRPIQAGSGLVGDGVEGADFDPVDGHVPLLAPPQGALADRVDDVGTDAQVAHRVACVARAGL